jgi:hypothetical protein
MSGIEQPSRGGFRSGGFRSGGDLAVLVLLRPLLWVAHSRLGRRLAAAATLALVTAALVVTLYDHPDIGGGAGLSGTRPVATGRRTPAAAASRSPERAAVSWYARQLGAPQARVRALQRRRIGDSEVRVMVIADLESGRRLPTAVVTVRRDRTGWKVAP